MLWIDVKVLFSVDGKGLRGAGVNDSLSYNPSNFIKVKDSQETKLQPTGCCYTANYFHCVENYSHSLKNLTVVVYSRVEKKAICWLKHHEFVWLHCKLIHHSSLCQTSDITPAMSNCELGAENLTVWTFSNLKWQSNDSVLLPVQNAHSAAITAPNWLC